LPAGSWPATLVRRLEEALVWLKIKNFVSAERTGKRIIFETFMLCDEN